MSESYFLIAAIIVFSLLLIGLVLTVIEFRHGEPHEEVLDVERHGKPTRRDR
ncbi:hypothetical protein [Halomonas denitrificans]|nr:hypothetical protein [Halomonas denitrificans]